MQDINLQQIYIYIHFRHLTESIHLCCLHKHYKISQMTHFGDEAMDEQRSCEQVKTGQLLYDVVSVTLCVTWRSTEINNPMPVSSRRDSGDWAWQQSALSRTHHVVPVVRCGGTFLPASLYIAQQCTVQYVILVCQPTHRERGSSESKKKASPMLTHDTTLP